MDGEEAEEGGGAGTNFITPDNVECLFRCYLIQNIKDFALTLNSQTKKVQTKTEAKAEEEGRLGRIHLGHAGTTFKKEIC